MIEEAVRRAGPRPRVSFEVADAAALPFPDASFDAVMAQTLLAHVHDPIAILAQLWRVTRSGVRIGALDLDTQHRRGPPRPRDDTNDHRPLGGRLRRRAGPALPAPPVPPGRASRRDDRGARRAVPGGVPFGRCSRPRPHG
jgi:SAM-dependent methyltransferase